MRLKEKLWINRIEKYILKDTIYTITE
jgi:hypothetical protein